MTSLAEEPAVADRRSGSHAFAEFLARFRELGIVLALVIVVGAATLDNHLFLSAANVQQILAGSAIIALLAIGVAALPRFTTASADTAVADA